MDHLTFDDTQGRVLYSGRRFLWTPEISLLTQTDTEISLLETPSIVVWCISPVCLLERCLFAEDKIRSFQVSHSDAHIQQYQYIFIISYFLSVRIL